jgi:integrase
VKIRLSKGAVESARPRAKPYEIRDGTLPGFLLRVQPAGSKTYYLEWSRGRRIRIGLSSVYSAEQARTQAAKLLREKDETGAPQSRGPRSGVTLEDFLASDYEAYALAHMRTGESALAVIRFNFKGLLSRKLSDIGVHDIERWRTQRLASGTKPSTLNRATGRLRAALSKALEWGLVREHPLGMLKPAREDDERIVRYLSPEEEQRLRMVLRDRDALMRSERDKANEWRISRGYELYAEIPDDGYGDVLTPLALTALNTGMRKGEMLDLRWADIDFERAQLVVRGPTAKDRDTRRIPMNSELLDVLRRWKLQANGNPLVFPGRSGDRRDNVRKSWGAVLKRAGITAFRFHDTRHHFASRLVMNGVDLFTVSKLLGHSNARMTERYAHLAPGHLREAVEKLVAA